MLEALEDGLAEPGEYLPAIGEQVQTLSSLVDDLFELPRIDADVLRLELHDASTAQRRRQIQPRPYREAGSFSPLSAKTSPYSQRYSPTVGFASNGGICSGTRCS